ncbi:MAG: TonB-dependent receptor plug domain-containing protein [Sulfurimonas sp.]|nr:TonB-dependent receptor plug domain-containing protein [Sulfurimonas sp.]
MSHFFSLILISTLLLSNDIPNFEDDFLQSLEEVSEIATKSKLNIDDAPAFVTVLNHEKLRKLGIDNVQEALAQVPGVQLKREAIGVPVIIFRGVSQKGEVKLMLDGVSINNTYRGSIYHFLDFPIELVERIEVIRGAGSVLYGSGAISGVINIITKSSSSENINSVFISGGSYNYYKGGALVASNFANIKIAIDTYYQENQKFIESTDRHLTDYSVGLKINDEHFALLAKNQKSDIGKCLRCSLCAC